MGGLGSGGYYRFDKKDRAEDCLSLDVRRWQREGFLDPGRFFGWAWYREGRKVSSISVSVLRGAAKLSYSIGLEGRKEDFRYTVPLTWTPCNFGGSRPWFVCPGVVEGVSCGRRVAKFYLKYHCFLCRYCHDLTYTSRQEKTGWYGALRRCQRIRQKLGGSVNMTEPFSDKPKGMHHSTYRRMLLEYKQAHEEFTRVNDEYARKLIANQERLTGRAFKGLGRAS